jgi:cyclic beta-1,2-glucan synthetase
MSEIPLLSNDSNPLMVTASSNVRGRWECRADTRWYADAVHGIGGALRCLHNDEARRTWSTAIQPGRPQFEVCRHHFAAGRSTFWRHNYGVETRSEIAVLSVDFVKLQRIIFTTFYFQQRILTATEGDAITLRSDSKARVIVVKLAFPRDSNSTQRRNTCSSE